MSIAAMMQEAAANEAAAPQRRAPTRRAIHRRRRGTPAELAPQSSLGTIASELTRYIPTEAVALYTAILPFLVVKDIPLEAQDYTARWWLAIGVGIFAVLYAVGIYKREIEARKQTFRWPPRRTVTVMLAYSAWVFVIPGSPVGSFSWYTPTLGAIIGLAATAALSLFSLWFGGQEGG